MRELYVLGAGVRGRLVADLVTWQFADRYVVCGYYDDRLAGNLVPGNVPVIGTIAEACRDMPSKDADAFVATGTRVSHRGCALLAELQRAGVTIASLVAPAAHVSPSVRIGVNALVMPGVFIGTDVQIGDLFTSHAGVAVEHDVTIGDNVLLGPGVAVASAVRIGSHSFVGAGVSVIPAVTIGQGTFIGAGSTVVRDLPANCVAYGTPARPARETRDDDEVPTRKQIEALMTPQKS